MAVFREIWTLVKVRKSSIEKSAPSARIRRQRRIILLNVRKCLVISIIKVLFETLGIFVQASIFRHYVDCVNLSVVKSDLYPVDTGTT